MKKTGLRNKAVIITGAADGIGRATASRFAEEGARVSAWDVNEAAGEALPATLREAGAVDAFYSRVDVADVPSVEAAVHGALSRWGRIDILINNAGIVRDAQLVKWKEGQATGTMGDESFDAVIGVNLKGVFNCTRAAVPHMIQQGGGVVLVASSVVALYGNFGQTNYAASKAGVIAMTRTWARELGRFNIRVNAIAPGFIATGMIQSMPDKVIQTMVGHTPLGRLGLPEEIAEAYVWLASDAASFVHGAVLSVDGGMVLGT